MVDRLRGRRILLIEVFDGGSHAQFARTLIDGIDAEWQLCRLPARHWKWRMRGSALRIAEQLDGRSGFDLVLATSMFPLAELAGLCPNLAAIPKVLYFHENQFAYPSRAEFLVGDRDHHFGFTQIVSAAAATECWFNSEYNRDTFFVGADELIGKMPDERPTRSLARARAKARVLPIPLSFVDGPLRSNMNTDRAAGPTILWNHRWEHDKAPARFFAALRELAIDHPFRLSVCGQAFGRRPTVFTEAEVEFRDHIEHWGYCESAADYHAVLAAADIAVSTAEQEFFGIATLEAVHAGARPLVPDRLAYRETIPAQYRYRDDHDLVATLQRLCTTAIGHAGPSGGPDATRTSCRTIAVPYATKRILPSYTEALSAVMGS